MRLDSEARRFSASPSRPCPHDAHDAFQASGIHLTVYSPEQKSWNIDRPAGRPCEREPVGFRTLLGYFLFFFASRFSFSVFWAGFFAMLFFAFLSFVAMDHVLSLAAGWQDGAAEFSPMPRSPEDHD